MHIKDLSPNLQNPRSISPEKLSFLKKSLDKFGDLSGIVYNKKSKQIVSGHQRIKVLPPASKIEITKVYKKPTSTGTIKEGYLEAQGERFSYREVEWDEPKEKAANIAANKGAGEWDLTKLGEWFKDLDTLGFDLNLTMFDQVEREELFPELVVVGEHTRSGPTGVDEDEVPEQVEPKTKMGDLYQLGEHRLVCGDSTQLKTIERLLNGSKVDMVFTDPPYGIDEKTERIDSKRNINAKSNNWKRVLGDKNTDCAKALCVFVTELAPTIILWGANFYCHALPETGNWIVWDKRVEDKQRDDNSDCELAWVKTKKRSVRIFRHLWKGMIKGSEYGQARVHPTQKPIALAEWSFETYSSESKNILDLFGGSGSTLIACEKTKRKCFMAELDPHYCDVIVSRWEKYTGKKAKLISRAIKTVKNTATNTGLKHGKK